MVVNAVKTVKIKAVKLNVVKAVKTNGDKWFIIGLA